MFLKSIQFSKAKASTSLQMAVNMQFSITAFGWLDGNPVYMLTTSDRTDVGLVNRRVNSMKIEVRAPAAVSKYNKYMQAVD